LDTVPDSVSHNRVISKMPNLECESCNSLI